MKPEYFYDEQLKKLSTYTYFDFISVVALMLPEAKIDVNKTVSLSNFQLIFKNNEHIYFGFYYDLYEHLNSKLGLDIDLAKSYKSLQEYTLYFNTVPEYFSGVPEVVKKEVKEEKDVEVVVNFKEMEDLFDKEDEKTSKKNLKKLVKDTYGVDLNARLSFDKMIAEAKEKLK